MKRMFVLTIATFIIFAYVFSRGGYSSVEFSVKSGSSEIKLSHTSSLYSIAKYYVACDKELMPRKNILERHIYIPIDDSIGFYSVDDYHNEVFKTTRSVLFANYDSIISYVEGSYFNNSYMNLNNDEFLWVNYDSDFYILQNNHKYIIPDSLNMKICIKWLENFAKLIHYEDYVNENINIYTEFIEARIPCIEDMRIWLNCMFDIDYQRFVFITSPFVDPYHFDIYDSDSTVIIIFGGVSVMNKECDFSPDYRFFENLMRYYVDHILDEYELTIIQSLDMLSYLKIQIAIYLLYCHDMQSEETFLNEKNMIYCKFKELIGPEFKEFSKDIDSIYQKLLMDRDFKEKNLLHLYFECWENLNVR